MEFKQHIYKTKKVKDLIPYANNSRTHSEKQVKEVAASIKEFGFTNPILTDESNGIIAGHGRVLAAELLAMDEVPCIELTGLTDAQKKAYVIADNQLALNAGWNEEMLRLEILALEELDFDTDLLGFDDKFLDELLSDGDKQGLTEDDAIPNEPEVAVTKQGDVWLLGDHRLVCGDSTDKTTVALSLNEQSPNTMITDPPYGVEYEASWRADAKKSKKTEREKTSILKNDEQADWYEAYALFPGHIAYVWHAATFTDVVMDGLRKANFEIKQEIVWNKNVHALSRSDYHWKHESCWYAIKKGDTHNWLGGRSQMTVWDVDSIIYEKDGGGKTAHPTQKPVKLYVIAIKNHTNPGEYVYEPFCGSGTMLIAAEKTERRALAVELDEVSVDISVCRWQEFTGKEAIHEQTGKTYAELQRERVD